MTTGAQTEIDMARSIATAYRADLKAAVAGVGHALTRVEASIDVVETLRAWGDLALAFEALADLAAELRTKSREYLASAMSSTGATTVQTEGGKWSVKNKPAFVEIADPAAVPDEFLVQPPAAPDKKAIAAHLKAGGVANWARMVEPTSMTVSFTARKS
jgi:hypothetical protein